MTTDTTRALEVEEELVAALEGIRAAVARHGNNDVVLKATAVTAVLDAVLLLLEEQMARYEVQR